MSVSDGIASSPGEGRAVVWDAEGLDLGAAPSATPGPARASRHVESNQLLRPRLASFMSSPPSDVSASERNSRRVGFGG
ncbi:hypothetical protein MFU01_81880 [Myxococcus fulvus]|uniref:Uncharacterized protein n=1 Tax=Myxococcus fulvus TaxID=33 RepID=A0A511TG82_MYXFU|nr:hypothetical protein MFUL124B02_19265 [Myxococcus fulvus 124B02]GEN13151.1 hypothetical protein MFU01_81880 [Myxococcus fulvus]